MSEKKLLAVRGDLAKRIIGMANKDGRTVYSTVNKIFEEALKAYETETQLEDRLRMIETELAGYRSTPAVERKIRKIEEGLAKLRIESERVSESGEQEDTLKRYKTAEKRVFVIMPFEPFFEDVWKGSIKMACDSEGFTSLRVDKISLSTWINKDIEESIEKADVVIADITDNNPNVMFELGWALAKGKRPIIIRHHETSEEVPFDVYGLRRISYTATWTGIEELRKDIRKFIKATADALKTEKEKRGQQVEKKNKT